MNANVSSSEISYESLSILKSDTVQELKVIKWFMIHMKEHCPQHFNKRLYEGVDLRIRVHERKLINAMPIYRWLLSDTSLVDLGEDCIKVSIDWAIKKAGVEAF